MKVVKKVKLENVEKYQSKIKKKIIKKNNK